jgi:hypothetical protein
MPGRVPDYDRAMRHIALLSLCILAVAAACTGHGDKRFCDHFADVVNASPPKLSSHEASFEGCMADIEASKAFHGEHWDAYYACAMKAEDLSQLLQCSGAHRPST